MDQTVPAYAVEVADYGRSRDPEPGEGALVKNVRPESPAWDVGIEPGMRVLTVNGEQLTDMIVWLWEADDDTVELEVFDPRDGTVTPVELDRFPGEDWGLEFDGPIFDGMRTCVNACVFCFMTMLPKGGRSTLYIRDDDYRLSFLQGNFVTLTNLSDEDVQNVIDRNMSPMNVSVHAVSPDVRRRMMGRNAQRGMDVLEAIMAAGIEIHAQIVLCPGMNDGEELEKTLRFCEEHEQITSLGIVPLGFTKHQNRFSWSYSDKPDRENDNIWEFYSLGIGEPTPLSALHGHGTGDLLDDIVALLPEEEDEVADEFPDALNVAIIGRPNAGKSSLFNRILGADRSIVSNIAGTTRDAIDTVVERDGKHYRMVDTAGIRKKSTVYENIEYYSMVRGLRAIDRADVALLVVDSSVGVTEQDQKVMGLAIERGCAIVVLLNKWDLLDDDRKREACMETVDRRLGVMAPWAQYLRISALTGRSVEKIWAMVDAAEKTRSQKISTSRLNTFLTDLREFGHTVVDGKRRLRMHYVTQTGVNPPTFTFFVNHSDLVNDTYQRYVENRMRSTFDFAGTPIRLFFRKKEQKDA